MDVKRQNFDEDSQSGREILIGEKRRRSMRSSLSILNLDSKRYELEAERWKELS
jgi:hypothetical protein